MARRETAQMMAAFEIWRDLGYRRSFRQVAKIAELNPMRVSRWSVEFKWRERLTSVPAKDTGKTLATALLKTDDPALMKFAELLDRVDSVIDSMFTRDFAGKPQPKFEINDPDILIKLLTEYRKTLESYHNIMLTYRPQSKQAANKTNIRELNLVMGDLTQSERIAMLRGVMNGNDTGGDSKPTGGVQDADYTEVPGRGDEDGHGCDGVPGGAPDSGGGDT